MGSKKIENRAQSLVISYGHLGGKIQTKLKSYHGGKLRIINLPVLLNRTVLHLKTTELA